jgi:hypothetical protein
MALASPARVRAGTSPVFLPASSSISITHTDDASYNSPNTDVVTLTNSQIPAASPASFQLINTFTIGTSSSVADGGAYETTSSTAMNLGLKSGTGVTQTDPQENYDGPSELNVSANLFWQIGSSGFPLAGHFPGLTYSFNVGGTVGNGGEADFIMNMTYYLITGSGSPVQIGSAGIDAGFATAGAFTHLFSGSLLLNGGATLPANSKIELQGIISFESLDPVDPTSIYLIDEGNLTAIDVPPDNSVPLPATWQLTLGGMGVLALLAFKKRHAAIV